MINTIEELEALYGHPNVTATRKVADRMVPVYRRWIMASRFCILTTTGPEGTDGSPRGDEGPVVTEVDDRTLAMPDWHGNNRVDSLPNIVRDPRVSLMFMVPGSDTVVRVNGRAKINADTDVLMRFERAGKLPRSPVFEAMRSTVSPSSRSSRRTVSLISSEKGPYLWDT